MAGAYASQPKVSFHRLTRPASVVCMLSDRELQVSEDDLYIGNVCLDRRDIACHSGQTLNYHWCLGRRLRKIIVCYAEEMFSWPLSRLLRFSPVAMRDISVIVSERVLSFKESKA